MRERILTVLKFIFFVVIIPLLLAVVESFQSSVAGLKLTLKNAFYSGTIMYVVSYLFLYDFQPVYLSAKAIVGEMFKFLPPFDKVIPYVFPIYVMLTGTAYFFINGLLNMEPSAKVYFFIMGFLLSLHIISAAKEFQDDDKLALKPHYFFSLSLAFIGTVFTFVLLLHLITPSISFPTFWVQLCRLTDQNYEMIFQKILTLVKSISLF